jgi:hypothetical protein
MNEDRPRPGRSVALICSLAACNGPEAEWAAEDPEG